MGRLSLGFRRKSTVFNEPPASEVPPSPSFRVMERPGASGPSQMHSAGPRSPVKRKPVEGDDNMFAGMTSYRGSNTSSMTHANSTDNSSRHSNASTTPSSADTPHQNEEHVKPYQIQPQAQGPARGSSTKSIGSSLFKAPRTWSFGGQKKQSVPVPKDEPPVPDLPPMLMMGTNVDSTTPTGTASGPPDPKSPERRGTASTDSPTIDMGSDFSTMFEGMKRQVPAPQSPMSRSSLSHSSPSPSSPGEDRAMSFQRSPRQLGDYKLSNRPSDIIEDEDAKLLRESVSAMRFLSSSEDEPTSPSRRQNNYGSLNRSNISRGSSTIASTFEKEDNMFDDTTSRFNRVTHRYVPKAAPITTRNRVMTPAQFEQYRADKEKGVKEPKPTIKAVAAAKDEEDEDDINYDDDEDEHEKTKQQTRQRRKQEASMASYRQQKMRVAGEPAPAPLRPGLTTSLSTPHINVRKSPSPNGLGGSDEDEDEEVPLALLQANGFPKQNRSSSRLSHIASNPQLRNNVQPPSRPGSVIGDLPNSSARRASTLPAFARNLPQDPFANGRQDSGSPSQHILPPGGLVGVIATEERSRAMRRGSPNIDGRGPSTSPNMHQMGFDPVTGIPPQMMYQQQNQSNMSMGAMGMGGGMPPMQGMQGMQGGLPYSMSQMSMSGMPMQMPQMSAGEQAQIQMTQQMQQFMQMQMQFMQMMAMNQNGGSPQQQQMPQMPQMPMPGMPGMPGMQMPMSPSQQMATQSMTDLSANRHSYMGEPQSARRGSMRTMSMVQPSSVSVMAGRPASLMGVPTGGYAPSIAPSERSNVGLASRYRPVSQAILPSKMDLPPMTPMDTMSGANLRASPEPLKDISSTAVNAKAHGAGSDDEDDDQAWAAMKAKKEKKRSIWRSRKSNANELFA